MPMPLLKPNHVYTYVDYLEWAEDEVIKVKVLEDLQIELDKVFDN